MKRIVASVCYACVLPSPQASATRNTHSSCFPRMATIGSSRDAASAAVISLGATESKRRVASTSRHPRSTGHPGSTTSANGIGLDPIVAIREKHDESVCVLRVASGDGNTKA